MIEVTTFREEYVAGRATLGTTMPPKPPAIMKYVYRVGPLLVFRGGAGGIGLYKVLKNKFPISQTLGITLPFTRTNSAPW